MSTSSPLPNSSPDIDSCFSKWLKEDRHLADSTIKTKLHKLKILRRRVNIWDTDTVRRYIASSHWGNNYKTITEYVYCDWCRFNGFDYEITKYPKETKLETT